MNEIKMYDGRACRITSEPFMQRLDPKDVSKFDPMNPEHKKVPHVAIRFSNYRDGDKGPIAVPISRLYDVSEPGQGNLRPAAK